MARALGAEQRATEADRAAAARFDSEAKRMRAEAAALRSGPRVFQNNRCSACSIQLDLPAVHFLCMHSFHQRCLGENERECPRCGPDNRTVRDRDPNNPFKQPSCQCSSTLLVTGSVFLLSGDDGRTDDRTIPRNGL